MSDQARDGASDYPHHDATPGSAPDRSAHTALHDSFPASDPVATTVAVGNRAVDPSRMMPGEALGTDAHRTISVRFADREHAKLASERLIREVPLAPQALSSGDDDSTLTISVAAADLARACRIVRSCEGEMGFDGHLAELSAMINHLVRNRAVPAAAAGASQAAAFVRQRPLTTVGLLSAGAIFALAWHAGTQSRWAGPRRRSRRGW